MARRRTMSARDAADIAGADGSSLADDFIAMSIAGYEPDEHSDFLMDLIGEGVSELDLQEEPEPREKPKQLVKAGFSLREASSGGWIIRRSGKKLGIFYDDRARWRLFSDPPVKGRGMGKLLKALGVKP